MRRALALFGGVLALSACGLQPIYSGGAQGHPPGRLDASQLSLAIHFCRKTLAAKLQLALSEQDVAFEDGLAGRLVELELR